MKAILYLCLLACGGFLLSACDSSDRTAAELDKAQTETTNLVDDLKNYTYADREKYSAKLQERLDEMKVKLKELGDKIETQTEETKAKTKPKWEALKEKTANLETHLKEIKTASEPTWEKVKDGSRKALDSVKTGFQETKDWFNEKVN